jgi:hypothetical protein
MVTDQDSIDRKKTYERGNRSIVGAINSGSMGNR